VRHPHEGEEAVAAAVSQRRATVWKLPLPPPDVPAAAALLAELPADVRAGKRLDGEQSGRRVYYVAMSSDDSLAGLSIRWDTAAARAGLALVTEA
jgi:hypothetical protein